MVSYQFYRRREKKTSNWERILVILMSLDSIIIYLAAITLPPSKLMAQSHKPIQRGPEKYESRRNGYNS